MRNNGHIGAHFDAWNQVSASVKRCIRRVPVRRRPHSVLIVLADVDDRQIPQFRHVVRLVNLTLRGCPVAVERPRDSAGAVVFVSESQPGADRHLATDDPIAAVESCRVHVHRSASPFRDPGSPTHQFRENLPRRHSEYHRESVTPVSCDQTIRFGYRHFHPHGHCLLQTALSRLHPVLPSRLD